MLTQKEVEEKELQNGKDYLYLSGVRYREGEKFLRGDKEITIKKIVDQCHFLAGDNSCWHTEMFYDYKCLHGKNMIPLEYNSRSFNLAEQRLRAQQVFCPTIKILHGSSRIEKKGFCMIRYMSENCQYEAAVGDKIRYRSGSLFDVLHKAFGKQTMEVAYALQDWGESGEMPQELLLDDNCKTIVFAGIDNTEVCSGRLADDPKSRVTLLKKHCEPSHHYVFVRDLTPQEDGAFFGDELEEAETFGDAEELYNEFTGRSIEQSLNGMEM